MDFFNVLEINGLSYRLDWQSLKTKFMSNGNNCCTSVHLTPITLLFLRIRQSEIVWTLALVELLASPSSWLLALSCPPGCQQSFYSIQHKLSQTSLFLPQDLYKSVASWSKMSAVWSYCIHLRTWSILSYWWCECFQFPVRSGAFKQYRTVLIT